MQKLILGALLLLGATGPIAVSAGSLAPVAGQPVVVISAPWSDAGAMLREAGQSLLAPGRFAFIALAAPVDAAGLTRLKQSGALVLLDGSASSILCGVAT